MIIYYYIVNILIIPIFILISILTRLTLWNTTNHMTNKEIVNIMDIFIPSVYVVLEIKYVSGRQD